MLLKTKLLVALGTLGVAGGTGTGVYFLKKNIDNQEKSKEKQGQKVDKTEEERSPGADGGTGQGSSETEGEIGS